MYTIIVSNIHLSLNEGHIKQVFTACSGEPKSVEFVGNFEGDTRIAKVIYSSHKKVAKAVDSLNGRVVLEKQWFVQVAGKECLDLIKLDLKNGIDEINNLELKVKELTLTLSIEKQKHEQEVAKEKAKYEYEIEKVRRELELARTEHKLMEAQISSLKHDIETEKQALSVAVIAKNSNNATSQVNLDRVLKDLQQIVYQTSMIEEYNNAKENGAFIEIKHLTSVIREIKRILAANNKEIKSSGPKITNTREVIMKNEIEVKGSKIFETVSRIKGWLKS